MSKQRMINWILSLFFVMSFTGCVSAQPTSQPTTKPNPNPRRWEGDIKKFESQDEKTPPPASPILFVGSSTTRFWKVNEAFPNLPVLNRGFGGSETSDLLFYFDRVVAKYHPRQIVFYCGDNDLADGKSADQVSGDIAQFINNCRQQVPAAKLVMIAVKPCPLRWKLIGEVHQVNTEMAKLTESRPGDVFVDIGPQLLGPDGKPKPEFFRIDGLHLSDKGYGILSDAVRPYLSK